MSIANIEQATELTTTEAEGGFVVEGTYEDGARAFLAVASNIHKLVDIFAAWTLARNALHATEPRC
jgi:hypothetical protein